MIQKLSKVKPLDKNGVFLVKTFHLYGGFFRKTTTYSFFIKCSAQVVKARNKIKKKSKLKAIIIYTKKNIKRFDGSFIRWKLNSVVVLKKRLTASGREIFGPSFFELKRKRFMFSFIKVV